MTKGKPKAHRKVVRINLDESETMFKSIAAAAKATSIYKQTLGNQFKKHGNKQFRYRGYEWKYASQELDLPPGETEDWCDHTTLPIKVSSHGRIEYANGARTDGCICSNGYKKVSVLNKTYRVHRLVAETFFPDEKRALEKHCSPEVDHLDGNILNNHVTNLEWVTREENQYRAIQMASDKARKRQEEVWYSPILNRC